jgi:glucose-6-phosphate 1-dehydrogenase
MLWTGHAHTAVVEAESLMSNASGIAISEIPGRPLVCEPAPHPCTLVIFGATGDLTRRKLIPALYNLALDGRLPGSLAIVGVGRDPITAAALRALLRESTERMSRRKPLDGAVWDWLASRIEYVAGNFEDPCTYAALGHNLEVVEPQHRTGRNRVYYLAVPPTHFTLVVERLHQYRLLHEHRPAPARPWCRVVVEKPFGRDLESALALDRMLGRYLEESQIFRIDHYLGKETVQNILAMRFGNAVFEPLWNRKYIDNVQIIAAETIGVEDRGCFYDATGVLRDVVQSHLLQVLALVAAEAPISFAADDIRDEQVQLLRSLHPITRQDVARQVVRAQYRGYPDEEGVAPGSRTPTFVACKVLIDNWRWQGVPFYLRAGKKLNQRLTEVDIQSQPIPLCLFRTQRDDCQNVEPNVLSLRIQPDEGVSLTFMAKVPGDHLEVGSVLMNMSYASSFGRPISDAYERLILDIMRGDATLFARRDVVEQSWRFVTPILRAWEEDTESPIPIYQPGSAGPREAEELLARDGRRWLR